MKYLSGLAMMIFVAAMPAKAQSPKWDSIWNDPAIEQRIEQGIETNRKGNFTLRLPAYKGKTEIEIKQVKNAFYFGANAFMIKGFDSPQKNQQFEQLFSSLFNLAVVPFFWKTLEPQPGVLRFDSTSAPIYRRPPPDVVLGFCRKYDITPKGHCLVWNNPKHSMPEWLPKDTAAIEKLYGKRISSVAQRYGSSIAMWDVVNEAMNYPPDVIMPRDYVYKSFVEAAKSFSAGDQLMINEATTQVWQHNSQEYSPYYMMIQTLQQRGIDIKGIGIQLHFFSDALWEDMLAGRAMTPAQMFSVLDLYGRFDKPLQISEITIPTYPNNEAGRVQQAKVTRNFYRLYFSHPSFQGIIWWNPADGTAVQGEDKFNGGFLNNDLSPKPSYDALNTLINKEWKTNIKTAVQGNSYAFRGFYGDYVVRIRQGKKVTEQKIQWNKDGMKIIETK